MKKTFTPSPCITDRKKSILKNRDPETEQLLPATNPSSLAKKIQPPPDKLPNIETKHLKDDQKDNSDWNVSPQSPQSPQSLHKSPKAPLADLLAEFDGQENNANSMENLMNNAYLDQQNANIVLRCSRQACKLNSPAHNSSIMQDPLIAPYGIPLCICGAPMTPLPATQTINDNIHSDITTSAQHSEVVEHGTLNNSYSVNLSSPDTADNEQVDESNMIWQPPVSVPSRGLLTLGYNNRTRGNEETDNLSGSDNLNEESNEETKLIQSMTNPREYD